MAKNKSDEIIAAALDMVTSTLTARGMIHKDLAERLGVSQQRMSQILSGRYNVTVKTLTRIADALNLKLKIEFHG